jgi:hypothetical protein
MKIYNLNIQQGKQVFLFNNIFGMLLTKELKSTKNNKIKLPKNIKHLYQNVLNPFKLEITSKKKYNQKLRIGVILYAKCIVFLCKYSFWMAKLLTYFPPSKLKNTAEAIQVFKEIFPSSYNQRTLCLSRTLFAMATSKSFNEDSVVFIGVFLPSRKMHAWIIEKNTNPDPYDEDWVCYQPVAVISKR